jgi:hypothetical protein
LHTEGKKMTNTQPQRIVVNEKCPYCSQVVYADEGYYSTMMCHYSCYKSATTITGSQKTALAAFGINPDKPPRKKAGDGSIADSLKAMLTKEFSDFIGSDDVEIVHLIPASGFWKKVVNDHPRWHGTGRYDGYPVSFFSFSTMTELVRNKRLLIKKEDAFTYSV